MVKIKGGDKLEAALAKIAKNVTKAAAVDVGFLENATYPDGTSVALVAALNEFGHGTTPPRPFFRGMIQEKSPEWPKAIATQLKETEYDAAKTLGRVGEGIKGQLQQAIADYVGPTLSPITVAKKGNDKQLVDTGHMMRSADYRVKT
ncbi:hypothetical protein AB4037_23395 [Labrys sp. KB_33_2]|uniref:hypothetical protein n=1 Tax=Labrys sp. KB_33_2 TaxID=3237479 RepID=UPI003F8E9FFC